MRRCHQAIAVIAEDSIPWSFISPTRVLEHRSPDRLSDIAQVRGLNEEQMEAVHNIVRKSNIGVPYVIFGPPGVLSNSLSLIVRLERQRL